MTKKNNTKLARTKILSIGVPAYNQGAHLQNTIASLLNQTTQPFEIVISDNWSTDNTAEVIQTFGDRIKSIRPPHHMNMMEHWNFVVENLESPWFSLLSSDDEAKPNFVSAMLHGIESNENAILIRSGYENIDGEGKLLETRYIFSVKRICKSPTTLYEQLEGPKVNFSAFAVRKDCWKQVGGFPEDLNLFGDWGFWLKIAHLGDFIYHHDIVSRYRTQYRKNIKTERLLAALRDDIFIYENIIPQALSKIQNPDSAKVAKASKSRCFQNLVTVSHLDTSEPARTKALEILKNWAQTTDLTKIWLEVKYGAKLTATHQPNFIRKAARKILQRITSI